jgi:hypothetical protein
MTPDTTCPQHNAGVHIVKTTPYKASLGVLRQNAGLFPLSGGLQLSHQGVLFFSLEW